MRRQVPKAWIPEVLEKTYKDIFRQFTVRKLRTQIRAVKESAYEDSTKFRRKDDSSSPYTNIEQAAVTHTVARK